MTSQYGNHIPSTSITLILLTRRIFASVEGWNGGVDSDEDEAQEDVCLLGSTLLSLSLSLAQLTTICGG